MFESITLAPVHVTNNFVNRTLPPTTAFVLFDVLQMKVINQCFVYLPIETLTFHPPLYEVHEI
jgi:hypothetical protein